MPARWARYGWYWFLGLIVFIGGIGGTFAWFFHYLASLANVPASVSSNMSAQQIVTTSISPIDLAGVTATLGGLVLVGAFYKSKSERVDENDASLTLDLKLVGKFILSSSVCFILTYFMLQYALTFTTSTKDQLPYLFWPFVIGTDVAAIAAGFLLSLALGFLVTIVRFL